MAKMQPTPSLKDWLIKQLDQGRYEGAKWINRDEKKFEIPWRHKRNKSYKKEDEAIFKDWAELKRNGTDNYKSNFGSALRKSPYFEMLESEHGKGIRVYKIIEGSERARAPTSSELSGCEFSDAQDRPNVPIPEWIENMHSSPAPTASQSSLGNEHNASNQVCISAGNISAAFDNRANQSHVDTSQTRGSAHQNSTGISNVSAAIHPNGTCQTPLGAHNQPNGTPFSASQVGTTQYRDNPSQDSVIRQPDISPNAEQNAPLCYASDAANEPYPWCTRREMPLLGQSTDIGSSLVKSSLPYTGVTTTVQMYAAAQQVALHGTPLASNQRDTMYYHISQTDQNLAASDVLNAPEMPDESVSNWREDFHVSPAPTASQSSFGNEHNASVQVCTFAGNTSAVFDNRANQSHVDTSQTQGSARQNPTGISNVSAAISPNGSCETSPVAHNQPSGAPFSASQLGITQCRDNPSHSSLNQQPYTSHLAEQNASPCYPSSITNQLYPCSTRNEIPLPGQSTGIDSPSVESSLSYTTVTTTVQKSTAAQQAALHGIPFASNQRDTMYRQISPTDQNPGAGAAAYIPAAPALVGMTSATDLYLSTTSPPLPFDSELLIPMTNDIVNNGPSHIAAITTRNQSTYSMPVRTDQSTSGINTCQTSMDDANMEFDLASVETIQSYTVDTRAQMATGDQTASQLTSPSRNEIKDIFSDMSLTDETSFDAIMAVAAENADVSPSNVTADESSVSADNNEFMADQSTGQHQSANTVSLTADQSSSGVSSAESSLSYTEDTAEQTPTQTPFELTNNLLDTEFFQTRLREDAFSSATTMSVPMTVENGDVAQPKTVAAQIIASTNRIGNMTDQNQPSNDMKPLITYQRNSDDSTRNMPATEPNSLNGPAPQTYQHHNCVDGLHAEDPQTHDQNRCSTQQPKQACNSGLLKQKPKQDHHGSPFTQQRQQGCHDGEFKQPKNRKTKSSVCHSYEEEYKKTMRPVESYRYDDSGSVEIHYFGKSVSTLCFPDECLVHKNDCVNRRVEQRLPPIDAYSKGVDSTKLIKDAQRILDDENMRGGLKLESSEGDIYATRHCLTNIFYSTFDTPNHATKLDRDIRTKIFDYKFFMETVNDPETKDPSNEVYLGFGRKWWFSTPNDLAVSAIVKCRRAQNKMDELSVRGATESLGSLQISDET